MGTYEYYINNKRHTVEADSRDEADAKFGPVHEEYMTNKKKEEEKNNDKPWYEKLLQKLGESQQAQSKGDELAASGTMQALRGTSVLGAVLDKNVPRSKIEEGIERDTPGYSATMRGMGAVGSAVPLAVATSGASLPAQIGANVVTNAADTAIRKGKDATAVDYGVDTLTGSAGPLVGKALASASSAYGAAKTAATPLSSVEKAGLAFGNSTPTDILAMSRAHDMGRILDKARNAKSMELAEQTGLINPWRRMAGTIPEPSTLSRGLYGVLSPIVGHHLGNTELGFALGLGLPYVQEAGKELGRRALSSGVLHDPANKAVMNALLNSSFTTGDYMSKTNRSPADGQ